MNIPEILFLLLILMYFIVLPPLFKRAGEASWKGYVPIYNWIVWIKMLKRDWWWIFLLFVPGVNLLVFVILNVETAIAFNQRSTKDQWFAGALPWVFLPKLAFKDTDAEFVGRRDWTNKKKSFQREWGEAILFAIIAASVIRSFFLEAFTIPTASMEGSMLVGDYLFVSKMSYGAKLPETPLSIPFVHNVIPKTMTNSYVEWFKLPNFRLPGFGDVDRYDAVVFNFPHGDTVLVEPSVVSHDYYAFLRGQALKFAGNDFDEYAANEELYKQKARAYFESGKCDVCAEGGTLKIDGIRARPTDKKDNYVKRCIGLPGENLEIKNKQVYIDGEAIRNPENLQYKYGIKLNGNVNLNVKKIASKYRLMNGDLGGSNDPKFDLITYLTSAEYEELKKWKNIELIEPISDDYLMTSGMSLFPNVLDPEYSSWTNDNYGPIHIPAEGETLDLNMDNIVLYKKVIRDYEHNDLVIKEDGIYINGEKTDSYTFKQNYYWMMGDNRHGSADSRSWGYVPEDHVVGKAVFTWFSKEQNQFDKDNQIRWSRMFKTVGKGFDD